MIKTRGQQGEGTIANIVLIESDEKIRREMKRFILEIDDTYNVREFNNYEAFDKRYFQVKNAPSANIRDHKLGKNLKDEKAQWLQEQTLAESVPFSPSPLVLELSKKDLTVTSMDRVPDGKILGIEADKLINASEDFDNLITAPFKPDWNKFLNELQKKGAAQALIAFRADPDIWILNIIGKAEGDHFKIELHDAKKELTTYFKITEKKEENTEEGLQLLGTVHCVICRKDDIQTKDYVTWAKELKSKLKKSQFFPPDNESRIIVTKYDDDGLEKGKLLCDDIEDLVSLPLDRPIFMQKLEFILAFPKRVRPSFLFTQPLTESISISKKSYIDRINDLCISILNPTPLKPGVPAVVFIRLNYGEPLIKLYCKAVSSDPHPELSNLYRVTLSYFGIQKNALMGIKKFLNDKKYKQLINPDPKAFEFNPHNLFLTDSEKEKKNIVIIDSDLQEAHQLKSTIEGEIDNIRIFTEASYSNFINNYLSDKKDQKVYAPLANKNDLFESKIEWLINSKKLNLIQPLTPYNANHKIFGFSASEVLESSNLWLQLFASEESEKLLAKKLEKIQKKESERENFYIEATDFNGELKTIHLEAIKEVSSADIKIILSLPSAGSVNTSERVAIDKIDILLIDALFLPDALNEWHAGLNGLINKYYPKQKTPVSVIALKDSKTKLNLDNYLNSSIHNIFNKSSETKRLFFALASTNKILFTAFNVANLGWYDTKQTIYLAKPVVLTQIAEYGCAINLPRPLKSGTPLYLHEFIFDNAPDGNLCAKVMYSEPHDDKALGYVCYLNYFGINDTFLKYTRNWIRESYAQMKESSSS